MQLKRFNKQLNIDRNLLIISVVSIITLLSLGFIVIVNLISKPSGDENITTQLKNDSDFLEWFKDFDILYNDKVKTPQYSLDENLFKDINKFIDGDKKSKIIFKENKYLMDNISLELDVNTRSLRYLKYNKDVVTELLEINLINGKYYVVLITEDWEYKIRFNKDDVKVNKVKNKKNEISINERIFGLNNFEW